VVIVLPGITRSEVERRGVAGGGEDTSDRWGPVDRETRERRSAQEGVN
jgi:hypothetical protein